MYIFTGIESELAPLFASLRHWCHSCFPLFVRASLRHARARDRRGHHSRVSAAVSPSLETRFTSPMVGTHAPGRTPNSRSPLGTTPRAGGGTLFLPPVPAVTIADAVFSEIRNSGTETKPPELTDRHLEVLCSIFDEKHLGNALDLVQSGKVKALIAEKSQRKCFQVRGRTAKEEYLCYPDTYCSCRAFQWDVISRGERVACKHQLAVKIASALNAFSSSMISDLLMAQLLEAYTRTGSRQ